jgi:uncharacterized protein YbjT (DUF2867 family)
METPTILVTGATGNVGRHVVEGLRDAGAAVRAMSRAGGAAVTGDLRDPNSVAQAATGCDAAFLVWPFSAADGVEEAVAALASRVGRIVYLSAMSAPDGVWGEVERAIERSGVAWTFLRAGGFATNTLAWAGSIRSEGAVHWVYGRAARSLIHERDIADVAVRALTDARHAGAKYVLTGPDAIAQADQARVIGETVGLPVRWEEMTPDALRPALTGVLGDTTFAEHALAYWASLISRPEPVTATVAQVTGRPPRTFRDWARDHAADFRPRTPEEVIGRYVAAFRDGDFETALRLLAPDVLRVAPLEPGASRLQGVEAVVENSRRQPHEVRGVEVEGPFARGDRFAVRFTLDLAGAPSPTEKMSLYTVRDGAIAREDVYYHTPPG